MRMAVSECVWKSSAGINSESADSGTWNDDSVIIHRLYHKLTIYCHVDDMDYPSPAVCFDCMCLMSLIWTMTSLSYDGDGTVNRTRHDGGYDCSPTGKLGCLPRRLCLPWVMDVMTQFSDEDQ